MSAGLPSAARRDAGVCRRSPPRAVRPFAPSLPPSSKPVTAAGAWTNASPKSSSFTPGPVSMTFRASDPGARYRGGAPCRARRRSGSHNRALAPATSVPAQPLLQRVAVDVLHHQVGSRPPARRRRARRLRVIQAGDDARFAHEAGATLRIVRRVSRQRFERDGRLKRVSTARYTSPMPPAAISACTS